MAAMGPDALDGPMSALRRYDLLAGRIDERRLGAGNGASEPLFVPRAANADEDDGYVVALVYEQARNASEFLILNAADIAGDPVARVRLPHRVPYGFHGNWVPAE
jgi:carotenoid cleavage dioxygenase